MQHISANGKILTPGSKVRKDGKIGMWDGPCGCNNCRANPGWTETKGSVLGSNSGELEGSFEASELECLDEADPIPRMTDNGMISQGNARMQALIELQKRK